MTKHPLKALAKRDLDAFMKAQPVQFGADL
jgi:hypothetical protein